jgi:hypothetical protein
VRSHAAAAGAAITDREWVAHATDKAEAAAPEATEAATAAAPAPIAGTPTHGYAPTREAG